MLLTEFKMEDAEHIRRFPKPFGSAAVAAATFISAAIENSPGGPDGDAPAAKKSAKSKKSGAKKAGKPPKPPCVESCQPAKRSGCTIQGKGRPAGNLSCVEVHRR